MTIIEKRKELGRILAECDEICKTCNSQHCRDCITSDTKQEAYEEYGSFTAFAYVDGDYGNTHDLSTYDNSKEAIDFAKRRNWDEVVNDITGEVVWHNSKLKYNY